MTIYQEDEEGNPIIASQDEEIDPQNDQDIQGMIQPAEVQPAQQQSDMMDLSKIQAARAKAGTVNNIANIGQGFSNMISQGQMADSNANFFNGMRQGAQNEVAQEERARNDQIKNYMLGQQQKQNDHASAMMDPASEQSAAIRNTYAKMFPDIVSQIGDSFQHLSAADIKDNLSKNMELKMQADSRASIAAENRASREALAKENAANRAAYQRNIAENRADSRAEKEDRHTEDQFVKFGESLKNTRGDPVMASEQKKLGQAIHAKTMVNKDPSKLSPLELTELSQAMASQFSGGGQAAISTIEHTSPQTVQQDLAKAMSYVTGKPVSANSPEFVKLFSHMLDRQIETSQGILSDKLGIPVEAYSHLAKKDPIRFSNMMKAAGLSGGQNGQHVAYEPASVGNAKMMQPTAPGVSGNAIAAGEDTVKIQAPNGEIRSVKKDAAEKYMKMGGKVVQ